jgi:hypothetical protein
LITVNLGSGSSAYGRPFEQPDHFQSLIDEAAKAVPLKHGWSSITLSGFSAGYGAVRAILRQDKNFAIVNNVLLLDGMHASYSPEGKVLADGGMVNAADLDSFVKFAREAVAGRKTFVFSHSEIFPGTYASTTECSDYLLSQINVRSKPDLRKGPIGMQRLSSANAGKLYIFGYAGNTAPDHVDHLQAMPFWLKSFRRQLSDVKRSPQVKDSENITIDRGNQAQYQAMKLVGIRRVNIVVEATDASGFAVEKKIPYIEFEFDLGQPDLGLNAMHVVRIGDTDFIMSTWTKQHHGILRIEPKDFDQLRDKAFMSYRIGQPIPKRELQEAFARGEAPQVIGVNLGRLNKSLISRQPAVDRKANEIF